MPEGGLTDDQLLGKLALLRRAVVFNVYEILMDASSC